MTVELSGYVRRIWERLRSLDGRLVDALLVTVLTAAVLVDFMQTGLPLFRFPTLLLTTLPLLSRRRPSSSSVLRMAGWSWRFGMPGAGRRRTRKAPAAASWGCSSE
jgi:hypothetical protein